jgi:hypothetical protein
MPGNLREYRPTSPGTRYHVDQKTGRKVITQTDFPNSPPLMSRQGIHQHVVDPLRAKLGRPPGADQGYYPMNRPRPDTLPPMALSSGSAPAQIPQATTPSFGPSTMPKYPPPAGGPSRPSPGYQPRQGGQNQPVPLRPGYHMQPDGMSGPMNPGGSIIPQGPMYPKPDPQASGFDVDFSQPAIPALGAKFTPSPAFRAEGRRMDQDFQRAQQNSVGRTNASRMTVYGGDAPNYAGPFVAPGVQLGPDKPPIQPDGTRLGDAYAAAMGGQLRPGAMPPGMPMMPPGSGGPMFDQGHRDGGVTRDPYGFAAGRPQSRQNFIPYAGADPGAPGFVGHIGGESTLNERGLNWSRPPADVLRRGAADPNVAGSGLTVMSPKASEAYRLETERGASPQESLRSAQRSVRGSQQYKDQVQAQADRMRPRFQAEAARKNDLRALAQSRKAGVAPDKGVTERMGKGMAGYLKQGNVSAPKLTMKDMNTAMDPAAQAGYKSSVGYEPATVSDPQVVLDNTLSVWESLDPNDTEGRETVLTIAAATAARPGFGRGNKSKAELDAMLKDPDGYAKRRKTQPTRPPSRSLLGSMIDPTGLVP